MNNMLDMIKKSLRASGVEIWRINEDILEEAELYFVRHNLDMRRMKNTHKYNVGVYRDFEINGTPMLGYSKVTLTPSQTQDEIDSAVSSAFYAASFVANPKYTLPEAVKREHFEMESDLSSLSVEDAALRMAEAHFSADTDPHAFINSSEFFARKYTENIYTSYGTDLSYTKFSVYGEFIVQCKTPQDVEIYHDFSYDSLACDALAQKTGDALRQVSDRAVAKPELKSGTYDVILSGDHVATILSYYVSRSSASMIYPGYSTWKTGSVVQSNIGSGEAIDISLHATRPYSDEGILMRDRKLIENGSLRLIHGDARLSSYLGVEPTGSYNSFTCGNGSISFDEMKKKPCLYPVSFSDFQMDPMSGHFGGEIRLAYYFDGNNTKIVTGGSINGSINECDGDFLFSIERFESEFYRGPFAVLLKNVKGAGTI